MNHDLIGIRLACKYSFSCNTAVNYGFSQGLLDFVRRQENADKEVEDICKILGALKSYGFYERIAAKIKREDVFSLDIVSFHWKAWPLKGPDFFRLCHNFYVLESINKLPAGKADLVAINECLVHPAQVAAIGQRMVIKYRPVARPVVEGDTRQLVLSKFFHYAPVKDPFALSVRVGSFVALHFSNAVEAISEDMAENLVEIIQGSIREFNKVNAPSR